MTNEVTKRENRGGAPQNAARFVSIFEDPEKFAARMQIAEALSQTQFVPDAFKGRPADCLVALDMAERLGLNPLAVFPDLYVIDSRAAFSSKFLIALVNRSGRFSRIEYEEGIDGEAVVTKSGWGEKRGERKKWAEKVPNYYAVAHFTELASSASFESPRIDIAFAEKNGWIEKPGSKWATMPEIMVRYRAAAILIRTVCPEITMGLEWAEDLQDARETRPATHWEARIKEPAATAIEPPAAAQPATKGEDFAAALENARTTEELDSVAARIGRATIPENVKKTLRVRYMVQKKALEESTKEAANESPATSELVINRDGVEYREEPREEVDADPARVMLQAIRAANDSDALRAVGDAIRDRLEGGDFEANVAAKLFDAIEQRALELEERG